MEVEVNYFIKICFQNPHSENVKTYFNIQLDFLTLLVKQKEKSGMKLKKLGVIIWYALNLFSHLNSV